MSPWLDIATLEKMKHADGRFVAVAATGLPFLLQAGMAVHLVPPQLDVPRALTVASVEGARGASAVIGFAESLKSDQAQALVGCHCVVARAAVADALGDDRVAQSALHDGFRGWTICDERSGRIGQVVDLVEHPTQLTLTVDTTSGHKLVPLVDDLIVAVDEDARTIVMSLPAGLLEV